MKRGDRFRSFNIGQLEIDDGVVYSVEKTRWTGQPVVATLLSKGAFYKVSLQGQWYMEIASPEVLVQNPLGKIV